MTFPIRAKEEQNWTLGQVAQESMVRSMLTHQADISGTLDETSSVLGRGIEVPVKRSWGLLTLAVIEAFCIFFVILAKTGLVVGGLAAFAVGWARYLHRDIIRVPVLLVAIAGAGLNLYLLWKRQQLRNAPAAAWRKKALTKRERFRIALVLSLSILTLAFASCEIYLHRLIHHTIM
jgi:hypothetical protein